MHFINPARTKAFCNKSITYRTLALHSNSLSSTRADCGGGQSNQGVGHEARDQEPVKTQLCRRVQHLSLESRRMWVVLCFNLFLCAFVIIIIGWWWYFFNAIALLFLIYFLFNFIFYLFVYGIRETVWFRILSSISNVCSLNLSVSLSILYTTFDRAHFNPL